MSKYTKHLIPLVISILAFCINNYIIDPLVRPNISGNSTELNEDKPKVEPSTLDVEKPSIALESTEVEKDELGLKKGDKAETLEVTPLPSEQTGTAIKETKRTFAQFFNIPGAKFNEPRGFFSGIWHGFIIAYTFIFSLFFDIGVYAKINAGWSYYLGYAIGVIALIAISVND